MQGKTTQSFVHLIMVVAGSEVLPLLRTLQNMLHPNNLFGILFSGKFRVFFPLRMRRQFPCSYRTSADTQSFIKVNLCGRKLRKKQIM